MCQEFCSHRGGVSPHALGVAPQAGIPVCNGADTPRQADIPQQADPPTPDGHCSRRYASYWNAFLFETYLGHVLDLFGTFLGLFWDCT